MSPYIEGDPDLTQQQKEAIEAHLAVCPACRRQYEQDKQLVALVTESWDSIPEGTRELIEQAGSFVQDGEDHPITVEEGWEDLKKRSVGLAVACSRQEQKVKRHRLFWRIGAAAAAASILIAVGITWVASGKRGDNQAAAPHVIATKARDTIAQKAFAEFITSSGRRSPLALGQPVQTDDKPQEVVLGGMHRVVLNGRTSARFTSGRLGQSTQRQARYDIQLAEGELYVEVVPGHTFTVRTDNALLRITGTKFNVLAKPGRTELILIEGSVRFSRLGAEDRWVDVSAGYASTITGQSAPSAPQRVDALAAVAWAQDLATKDAIAHMELDEGFLDMVRDSWLHPSPVDPDAIDCDTWLEEQRDWFVSQFPWIFRVQKYLAERHGVEADYVELLLISGDIWQFNYPRSQGRGIPIFNPATIERIAKHYEVDCSGLMKAARVLPLGPLVRNMGPRAIKPYQVYCPRAYLPAVWNWRSDVIAAAKGPEGTGDDLVVFTWRAGRYLANTRTAAYLWVKSHPQRAEQWLCGDPSASRPGQAPSLVETTDDIGAWLAFFHDQAVAAGKAEMVSQKLLTAIGGSGSKSQAASLAQRLSVCLEQLAPPAVTTTRSDDNSQ